jgi:hypothetical protein
MFEGYLEDLKRKQELYSRWAVMQGREPSWADFMRYSGDPEADAYISGLEGEMAARPEQADKDDDIWNQIFLMSLMEEMQGGDPGQAPGVVLGGRSGNLPSMMGQFKRQQKPWWIV